MTEERLREIEMRARSAKPNAITHPLAATVESMRDVLPLLAEVRRLQAALAGANTAARVHQQAKERFHQQGDRLRTAIRKALHSGQVGQDAAAMLLEALTR